MVSETYSLQPYTQRPRSFRDGLRDGLSAAFRRKRLVMLCVIGTLAAAVLAALFLPRYHGEAKILVHRERVDPVLSSTPEMTSFALAAQPIVTDEDLRSEVELLTSTEVLTDVAKDPSLVDSAAPTWWSRLKAHFQPEQSYDEKVAARAKQLDKDLVVEPAKGSYIIDVIYKSKNRTQAKVVMDKLLQVYIAKHTAVHHPAGQYEFFARQAEDYRKRMEAAEAELAKFPGGKNGAVAPAMDRELTMQKLAEFRFSLDQTGAAIAETNRQIRRLKQQERAVPDRITTQVRKADNPQLLEQLKSSLLSLELRRSELLSKYQPDYRPVQELNEQIGQAHAAIQHELASPTSDITTDVDQTHQMIRSDLAKAETELAGYVARQKATQSIVDSYASRSRDLDQSSLQEASLQRNLKAEEENYLLYRKKSEEARIADALDAHGMVNVAVAEPPLVPALPYRSPFFFGVLALIAMATASFGLIWSLEQMDQTFHTPQALEAYLGIPVLVSIPRQLHPVRSRLSLIGREQSASATWLTKSPPGHDSINGEDDSDKGAL
jgi:uncharacterized protein involved in exopolysaccharide biosynthesis